MSRPNFFCNTNTLKYLAQMEYSDDHEAIDISVDCIELPFWLLFSSDEENYYLKLIKRYEIFWHDENMSVIISELTANKTTGEASLKTYDTGDEFLSMINPGSFRAFFATCKNLSFYAQKNSMDTKFGDINPDEAGIMLTVDGDELTYKLVRGKERPEMMCFNMDLLDNGIHMARPYQNEIIERHAKGLLPLEDKIAAAESGDPICMEYLAQAYLNGNDDVKQDFKKAAYWWEKLADTGNALGQFNIGLLYAKGCGVKRDFAKAAEWMNKAAANGDADAPGVAKLYAETAEILKKAEAGDVSAQAAIAKIYTQIGGSLEQFGPDRDYAESFKWAKKAAGNGSLDGMYYLGLCYEHARGTDYDPTKAAMIYQKAAELGHAPSQWNLAVCYFNGQGCERNETKGLYWAYESADKGHDFAIQGLERMGKTLPQIIEYLSDNETDIKLVGTQYEGRADRCERIISGMELTYKIISDKNGDDAIECFYNGGSVGFISKWVTAADDLIALLKMDRITLTIKVKSCIPKSKRGARARNAEVHLKLIIKEKASKKAAKSAPKSAPEKPAAEAEKEKRKPEKVQLTEEEKKAIKEEKAKQAEKARQKRIAKQEEETKQKEEARQNEEKAKYKADMSSWGKNCAAIKAQREEKEKELLQAEKEQIEATAKANYDAALNLNQRIIDAQTKRKSQAEQFLASLSFFRFIEKNTQRSIIEDAEKRLADAKYAIASAEREYKSSMESAASDAQKKESSIRIAVEKELPLPVEPTMPAFMRRDLFMSKTAVTARQTESERKINEIMRDIYNVLANGGSYTITAILYSMPEKYDLTHSRLNQIVRLMKEDGFLIREERDRKAYFRLA